MADFEDIPSAVAAIRAFALEHWTTLPDHVKETLNRTAQMGASPVDRIVETAETIYANAPDLPAAAREVGAGLFVVAGNNGWHGLNEGQRATKAAKALRDNKFTGAPERKAQFGKPVVVPAPIAPPNLRNPTP